MKNGQAMTRDRRGFAAPRALVLAVGAAMVWGVIAIWAYVVFLEPAYRTPRTESITFLQSGEPVIASLSSTNYSDVEYRSLDRSPVASPGRSRVNPGRLERRATPRRWFQTQRLWNERIFGFSAPDKAPITWYAIQPSSSARSFYLQAFNHETKQSVGYVGRTGFRQSLPPEDECFDSDGQPLRQRIASESYITSGRYVLAAYNGSGQIFLLDGDSVLSFDLISRSLSDLASVDGVFSLAMVSWYDRSPRDVEQESLFGERGRLPDGSQYALLTARSDKRVTFVDTNTGESREFALPDELSGASSITTAWQGDEQLILQTSRGSWFDVDLAWITPDGEITRRETVRLAGNSEPSLAEGSWAALAVAPVPVLAPVLGGVASYARVDQGKCDTFNAAVGQVVQQTTPALIAVALLGVASAAWIAYRHRANYRGGVWLWPLLGLLLGPAGAVGYALHWKRPPRAKCVECGIDAPRDRDACPACQAEWPGPAPLGIEIVA